MKNLLPLLAVTSLAGFPACAATAPARSPDAALNALVEEYFERELELSPMTATAIGDSRYDDKLDATTSPGFREKLLAVDRAFLDRAHRIDAARLSGAGRVTYDVFVGERVTWTVTVTGPGTFEFRLFSGGYNRLATSAPITATVGTPPVLTVSTTTAARGTPVTVTLTNGYGGATDWLALSQVGSPATSYIQYTYVGANVTTRTWTVTMPNTPGTCEFRLYPNNGYTVAATSPPITVN